MSDRQTILIQNDLDIIEARMHVRVLARDMGLDLFDQARISLAASTLAIILGLDKGIGGTVTMHTLTAHGRVGVQVVCTRPDIPLQGLAAGVLDDAQRMVDELRVDETSTDELAVTLIKWAKRKRRNPSSELESEILPAGAN
ncbi:MAG: hypothetical protein PVF47_11105 [Anaerolineae bacterium]|jgi:hypothetical protein